MPPGAERSEVQPKAAQDIKAGQHMAFGISDFIPQGFPVNTRGGWQVIWQLHDGGTNGSPPVALEVAQGRLFLSNVGQHVKDLGAVTPGRNLAVQLDIAFAKNAGTVSVIRDGQQMLSDFKPPKGTMVDDSDYLKTGVYKDPDTNDGDASLFINDEKIGSRWRRSGTSPAPPPSPTAGPARSNRDKDTIPEATPAVVQIPSLPRKRRLMLSTPARPGGHRVPPKARRCVLIVLLVGVLTAATAGNLNLQGTSPRACGWAAPAGTRCVRVVGTDSGELSARRGSAAEAPRTATPLVAAQPEPA